MKLDESLSAVITGGASGLGEATARALRDIGVKVGIFDRNEERGKALAEEIGACFAAVDVSDPNQIIKGFEAVRAANGQERIMVNCAGLGAAYKTASRSKRTGEIRAHPIDVFQGVVAINLIGTFVCASQSAAGMLSLDAVNEDGERGIIVNTGSTAGVEGQIGQTSYAASKGGIIGMTLPMARDLYTEGVRCNTILPGFFDTPIYNRAPTDRKERLKGYALFPHRFGKPEEYASLVLEMCRNPFFNGEVVRLDGAVRMPPF